MAARFRRFFSILVLALVAVPGSTWAQSASMRGIGALAQLVREAPATAEAGVLIGLLGESGLLRAPEMRSVLQSYQSGGRVMSVIGSDPRLQEVMEIISTRPELLRRCGAGLAPCPNPDQAERLAVLLGAMAESPLIGGPNAVVADAEGVSRVVEEVTEAVESNGRPSTGRITSPSTSDASGVALRNELMERVRSTQEIPDDGLYRERRIAMYDYFSKGNQLWDPFTGQWVTRGGQVPNANGPDGINAEHIWARSRKLDGQNYNGQGTQYRRQGPTLVNMTPANARINADHGNKAMGDRWDLPRVVYDPPTEGPGISAGWYARALAGYAIAADLRMTPGMQEWVRATSASHPPTDFERGYNDLVEQLEHWRNPFIDDPTLVGRVDFVSR